MKTTEIAPGIACLPITIANAYFIGAPGTPWVLVDAGVPGKADLIRSAAEERFGSGAAPSSIILTHGHVDHAGSAHDLAQAWGVPIYAHHLESPYLTGKSAFPPKDPTVGGAMAFISRFLTTGPFDLRPHLHDLPPDGVVPGLPEWRWFHTPGHAPGHVALWNESRRVLLAGDAFTTIDVDSWVALLTKATGIHRPPTPLTYDWDQARESVRTLAKLDPFTIGCGHGKPISGPAVGRELSDFSANFEAPEHGRYIPQPAITDETGIRFVPPPPRDPLPRQLAGGAIALGLGATLAVRLKRGRNTA